VRAAACTVRYRFSRRSAQPPAAIQASLLADFIFDVAREELPVTSRHRLKAAKAGTAPARADADPLRGYVPFFSSVRMSLAIAFKVS
jgi:hypothetical protein